MISKTSSCRAFLNVSDVCRFREWSYFDSRSSLLEREMCMFLRRNTLRWVCRRDGPCQEMQSMLVIAAATVQLAPRRL